MKSNPTIVRGRANNRNAFSSRLPVIYGLLMQLASAAAAPLKEISHTSLPSFMVRLLDDVPDTEDPSTFLYLGVGVILVLLGGVFAGLTIALMGQDGIYLQVIATSGEGKEQRHAQRVHNLLKKGKHWVLVTLLLSNVVVNETLPIVLDRSLGGGWPAVLGSTIAIVIFGEVIPQSVCVRYGLAIGAAMSPFVLALMWILAPVAWPTAKLLDRLLGEDHGTTYKKAGLKTLVTLHKTLGTSPSDRLNQDEVTIISAVLDLKEKSVGDIMTPMEDVVTMSADTVLDEKTMDTILNQGYSRIPIYEPGNNLNFVGMLLVKMLITYDPEDCKKVSDFALATLPETRPETSCLDIVNFFQEGKSHMVLVSDYPAENYGALGVVTLEDVIEELIGEEIIDESDVYIDVHKAIRRMAPAPKARVQKGQVVENPEMATSPQEYLIDLSEERPQLASRLINGNSRSRSESPAVAAFGSSPKATFMRRISGGVDGSPIPVRGNVNDMREHLKHLGPSNLASRPKTTRYMSVKIKPGLESVRRDSKTNSMLHRGSIVEESGPYEDNPTALAPRGAAGEPLLNSGREASDGVQSLRQGYGTIDGALSQTSNKPTQTERPKDDVDASAEVGKPSGSHSPSPPHPKLRRGNSDGSSDTLGSISSKDGSPVARKRGTARSGSITENIIEAGGIRKVVLETNSSSSDDKEDQAGSMSRHRNENIPPNKSSSSLAPPSYDELVETSATARGEEVKKKRRRQRKKKSSSARSSEETALLGESSNQ